MRGHSRDLDIGIPDEITLRDIHNKLGDVEEKVDDVKEGVDETNEELKKVSLGAGLITGVDLNEEVTE